MVKQFIFILSLFCVASSFAEELPDSKIKKEIRSYVKSPFVDNWQQKVGAQTHPIVMKQYCANDYGARPMTGMEYDCTDAIQKAIDDCSAKGGGIVYLKHGQYATGSLFLKDNVHFRIDKGVELLGALDDSKYPMVMTRAAGIELKWRAAIINVRNQKNVKISGEGLINARGARWWEKFWLARVDYEKKNLRWAVDYDIARPHLVQIFESENVSLEDLNLVDSPFFWTVHVVYSKNITVRNIMIRNDYHGRGPSTDGINIDSSVFVLVENCDVDCNDDCYCFKSGMNYDGQRVNIPVQYTLFRNCVGRSGHGGIVLGSDCSGGMRNCEAYNMKFYGTNEGIRFKSAKVRGGIDELVNIHDIEMHNVGVAISINLNWFPSFSYPEIPDNIKDIPEHWKAIAHKVYKLPLFRNINIENVFSRNGRTAISVDGITESSLYNLSLKNIYLEADNSGSISNSKNWRIDNVKVVSLKGEDILLKNTSGVDKITVIKK